MIVSRAVTGALIVLLAACGSGSDSPSPSDDGGSAVGSDDNPFTVPEPGSSGVPGSAPSPGDTTDPMSGSTPDDVVDPMPGDAGAPVTGGAALVTSDTYETILREIVAIANDETLDAASAGVEPVFDALTPLVRQAMETGAASGDGLAFVSSESLTEGGGDVDYTFSCDNGGSLRVRAYDDASVGGPFVVRMVADGPCTFGDAAYEGSAEKGLRFVRATDFATFERFSVTRADGDSLALDGEYSDTTPEQRGPIAEKGWSDATLVGVDAGETTRVAGYTSLRRTAAPSVLVEAASADADVRFSVTAPWSSNETLDVVVDLGFVDADLQPNDGGGPYPAQWRTGTIRVTAPDGSGLTLSPETGDPATFSVTIDGEGGDPIVRDWADGFQVSCSSPFDCR